MTATPTESLLSERMKRRAIADAMYYSNENYVDDLLAKLAREGLTISWIEPTPY